MVFNSKNRSIYWFILYLFLFLHINEPSLILKSESVQDIRLFTTSNYYIDINDKTNHINQESIQDEIRDNTWDYMTEVIFILFLAILTIPANLFLFIFYSHKVRRYKHLKHFNARYVRIENSFQTYLIEICFFDTIIVIYLILNTFFQFLYHLKKSKYESVFDISNFACKFFIYILRISSAMSNYLVFLLSLNRCLLIFFKYKSINFSSRRLCLNTKYLTLFLFCICTIANVFRLELLNINTSTQSNEYNNNKSYEIIKKIKNTKFEEKIINLNGTNIKDLTPSQDEFGQITESNYIKISECGPNQGLITYAIDSTNTLFWSMIIYNIFFAIFPAIGNLFLSIYLIKKRSQFKHELIQLTNFLLNSKFLKHNNLNEENDKHASEKNSVANNINYDEIMSENKNNNKINSINLIKKNDFQFNEFHAEFLKTCSPCIAFSLTHAFLFLPYSIIELVNQINPNFTYMRILQYMTYLRYIFYSSKFYLLFFVSYRFRREFKKYNKN